jgi:hypothetical protein
MAREIIKDINNTYNDIDEAITNIDSTWINLKSWDRFKFYKHPQTTYYVNPISPSIEDIKGPYKIFDLGGNTLQVERSSKVFKVDNNLFKYGPIIVYLKTTSNLYMLFVSRNAITDPYTDSKITLNKEIISTISINNTTEQSLYYNLVSQPIKPTSFIEIKSGLIEIIQPTSIVYLYLQNSSNVPITINSTNTRTKLVNNNFLLLCPTNYTKIQVAKLTGNPLSTIDNQLNLNITI